MERLSRLHRGGRAVPVDNSRVLLPQHMPAQNHILAALPPDDVERLLTDLEPVPLQLGQIVHGPGQRQKHLFFPTEGIVARVYETETGDSAAFAFTGNEGAIGVASYLGGDSTPSQAVVISPGYAYRLEAGRLQGEFEHDGPLPQLLLRYTQALIAQTAQIVVCNRFHSLEQQLCRLILSCLDRLPSNNLMMTQELISAMLGVRRESVTEVAGKLQQAGQIHYRRGHIAVLDRAQLEAHACECYGVVRREYDRLLFPENSLGPAGVSGPAFPFRHTLVNTSHARRQHHAICSPLVVLAPRSDGRR